MSTSDNLPYSTPAHSLGALYPSSLHPTPTRRLLKGDLIAHPSCLEQGDSNSSEEEFIDPDVIADTTADFRVSDETTGYESQCDEDQSRSDIAVPFWPNHGSRKVRTTIAAQLHEHVIFRLPRSRRKTLAMVTEMSPDDVAFRIEELFGYKPRLVQIETVHAVACQHQSLILVAKTGIGKSLIFEAIPLLDPLRPGVALAVMPLKHIQQQQLGKINKIQGARAAVYDGENCHQDLRYSIAAGYFTHGWSIRPLPSRR